METEKKVILDVEVRGDKTVKSLKEEIQNLRDALLNVENGSEEYNKVLDKLISDEKELTSVMQAGKKEVHAATGSYNALSQEMSALKRVWKEVTDEASRNEIGSRINDINNQLKDMDASVGVFNRNVGDYTNSFVDAGKLIFQNLDSISPVLGNIGGQINTIIPLIQKTTQVATKGLKGIKAALAATGVGLLVTTLGLLVQNWDKVTAAVRRFIPSIKQADDATKAQVETNEKLLEVNKQASSEMDYQSRIMEAQGASTAQIIAYKKKETESILLNTQAQIAETQAKIDSINAHGKLYRFFHGENKQLKELEESIKSLKTEEDNLNQMITKLAQDTVINAIKIKTASKNTTDSVEQDATKIEEILERLGLYGKKGEELINAQFDKKKEVLKTQFEEEKALFEKNGQDTTTLTSEYISRSLELENERLDAIQELREKQNQADADSLAESFLIAESGWTELIDTQMIVDKAIADSHEASLERQKELDREALKTRIGFYMEYAGSLQSILGTISDSWNDSIQSQLDAGEISEEEAKRQFEQIKQIQAAEAIINTIAGAVGVFMGISKDTGGWGIAAAIAKATAVLTAGMAQVAKIQSTTIGSKSASSQFNMNDAISNPQVNYTPTYTQNITNASETENLANALTQQPLKAYVVESDITNMQKRVKQRTQESTF